MAGKRLSDAEFWTLVLREDVEWRGVDKMIGPNNVVLATLYDGFWWTVPPTAVGLTDDNNNNEVEGNHVVPEKNGLPNESRVRFNNGATAVGVKDGDEAVTGVATKRARVSNHNTPKERPVVVHGDKRTENTSKDGDEWVPGVAKKRVRVNNLPAMLPKDQS